VAGCFLVAEDFQPVACVADVMDDFMVVYPQPSTSARSEFTSSQTVPGPPPDAVTSPSRDRTEDDFTPVLDERTCLEVAACSASSDAGDLLDWSSGVNPASEVDKDDVRSPSGMDVLASVCESLVVCVERGGLHGGSAARDLDLDTGHRQNAAETAQDDNVDDEFCTPSSSDSTRNSQPPSDVMFEEDDVTSERGDVSEASERSEGCAALSTVCEEVLDERASEMYKESDGAESCVDADETGGSDEDEFETSSEESSTGPCDVTLDDESSSGDYVSSDVDDDVTDDESRSEGTPRGDDVLVFDDAREFDGTIQPEHPDNQLDGPLYTDITESVPTAHITGSDDAPGGEIIDRIQSSAEEVRHESFATVPSGVDEKEPFQLSEELLAMQCVPQSADESVFDGRLIMLGAVEGCSTEVCWRDGLSHDVTAPPDDVSSPLHATRAADDQNFTAANHDENEEEDDAEVEFQDTESDHGELAIRSVERKSFMQDDYITRDPAIDVENYTASDVVSGPPSLSRPMGDVTSRSSGNQSEKDLVRGQQGGHAETFGVEDDDSSGAGVEVCYTDCEDTQRGGVLLSDVVHERDHDYYTGSVDQLQVPEVWGRVDVGTAVKVDVSRAVPVMKDTSPSDDDDVLVPADNAAVTDIYVVVPVTVSEDRVPAPSDHVNNRPDPCHVVEHGVQSSCGRLLSAGPPPLTAISPVPTASDRRAPGSSLPSSVAPSSGLASAGGKPDDGQVDVEGPGYSRVSRDVADVISDSENPLPAQPGYHSNCGVDEPAATSVASSNVDGLVAASNADPVDDCKSLSDEEAEGRGRSMTSRAAMTSSEGDAALQVVVEEVAEMASDELLYPDDHSTPGARLSLLTSRYLHRGTKITCRNIVCLARTFSNADRFMQLKRILKIIWQSQRQKSNGTFFRTRCIIAACVVWLKDDMQRFFGC